jgi:hypothetical protein
MSVKSIATAKLDLALDGISGAVDREVLCSSLPATYAAVEAATLAAVAITSGDFTKAAGTDGGRKTTVGAKTGVTPTATGTGTHIVLVDDTTSELTAVTPVARSGAINNANGYAAGSTSIALDALTAIGSNGTTPAILDTDTLIVEGNSYTIASVGAYADNAQTVTLDAPGLTTTVNDNAEVGIPRSISIASLDGTVSFPSWKVLDIAQPV